MTSVVLVDDHRMVREGLRTLLDQRDGIEVIGEANDGRTAVELVADCRPDVVVMDVGMPGLNGIEAARQIRSSWPSVRVVALSMHTDRRYVVEMLRAGASAYILKDATADDLVRAIHVVRDGGCFLSPTIANTVIEEAVQGGNGKSAFTVLTPREREVLQLIAEGWTSKQIAAELHLAVRTIEAYRHALMAKLDLHSVAELTKHALRHGLTSLE